jgi:endonuclease/exonuclease/phosphatase family metal-dependent hydrolase
VTFARSTGLALLLVLLAQSFAAAGELKLATWNLEWLTDRRAGDPELPQDVRPKPAEDIERLRHYAMELDADVVAIQEVDGPGIAARVFPPEAYALHLSRDRIVQRVGVAVRRGIRFSVNPDLTGLDVDPGHQLRSGVDITLMLPAAPLRILVVHLKTGCFSQRLDFMTSRACSELGQQVPPLLHWIAARHADGIAFALLGDFNRRMEGRDQFWSALRQTAPLSRATEGRISPCWGGEKFIDHIILGGPARDWLEPETLRVLTYRESDTRQQHLSDHCPVSVRLHVPG